jgi:hypothetical protein
MRLLSRLFLLLALVPVYAQLPVARLSTIFPPGAQIGVATEVKVDGADLDDAKELRFSNPGITSTLKSDRQFSVTAATNVAPGIYDVRVIGRFGASNPRAFVIGDRPEVASAGTNKSLATAQEVSIGSTVNGKAIANAPEYFKFKAEKNQRVLIECLSQEIDSKMQPVLVVYDSAGKELDRARNGGLLDFSAPAEGNYVLKLYDSQYRGGDEFSYRIAFRKGPWIDFALPCAIERGSKSKVTLYGRNLPNGKPSDFKIDGKPIEQFEIEIEAPRDAAPSYINRRPADAAVEGFEYHLSSPEGASNPIFLSFTIAPTVLESKNLAVKIPCEIQGQFFPRENVDSFQFEAAKGDILGIEIFSQRLGLSPDPFAVLQRVTKNAKGEEQVSDVQEMYASDQNVGGQEFNTSTRDPAYRFEAKDGGTYRIRVRDLFGETISDPRRVYRLAIRKESPDFALIAYSPAPPQQNKDSKEIRGSGAFLRRGDAIPIRILALRRDNYGGPIDVTAENLPNGVSALPLRLNAGANNGWLILSAAENASAWTGALQIVGKAKIGDKEIARRARAGAIAWNVADYSNEAVVSELTHELVLTVSGSEIAPLAIAASSEKPFEGVADSKVTIPLSILRRGDFNGGLKFRALLEPPKEFDVADKATNATFEIDLKQAKLDPGLHTIPVYATSPGKYRRVTPDEAKAIEDEIKTLKDGLAAITEATKKDAANAKIKSLEARLQSADMTSYAWTSIALSVSAPAQKTP